MDHVAIMDPKLGMIPKILSGKKTIESRWYLSRKPPWNKVSRGDTVYFKNSSGPIIAKAKVSKIKQFDFLQPQKIREILKTHNQRESIGFENLQKSYQLIKHNKFCILIFLKNPQKVKPFKVDKSGFGISSAWFCVPNINRIKK